MLPLKAASPRDPGMMKRVVEPEILDALDPHKPEAIRSRHDLRLINFLMGNERWILTQVAAHPGSAAKGITELGAGSGELLGKLARLGAVTGYDLLPRPPRLPVSVVWRQGDLWRDSDQIRGGILVASLFLHHWQPDELLRLGVLAERFEVLVFVEPLRTSAAVKLGSCLLPFVGDVTKHDMMVSIRAGFVAGELPELLGLSDQWKISEQSDWRGGHRMLASRV
jgi:hypothetical protein